ncbi:Pao retrotransposon peptidase [Popillia japonica]|uniref:Pao retrotransposon peptidase n=1 Tax=Popillia japonica TaxID=7064 RepID=A0AAW1MB08_POPJA
MYNSTVSNIVLDLDKSDIVSTLGLQWNPNTDGLQYSVSFKHSQNVTKRIILSEISKIFDPLGLVSPVVVNAKLLMQKVWQSQLEWDELLPSDIQESWLKCVNATTQLNSLKVPRHVITINQPQIYELHGFCDASEKAYGACIYIRATNKEGEVSSNLLCSKSKVAPLKATTLPRLELSGALLLAQLYA